jgi:hypothetical protein
MYPVEVPRHAAARAGFLLAVCLGLSLTGSGAAGAQMRESADPAVAFNIPAQPLTAALDAYSAATGKEVFYDGAAGVGRLSAAVKGVLTPDEALSALLTGTDLRALPSGASGYTLVAAPETAAQAAAARMAADRRFKHYFAVIQTDVSDTLCRRAETRPGPNRLLVRFWIGPSGAVQRLELKGTTGLPARDRLLATTLSEVQFDEPPPAEMRQPVTMAIFPGRGCPASGDRTAR